MKFKFQCLFIGTQPHPFVYVLSKAATAVEYLWEKPYGPQSLKYLLSGLLQKSLPIPRIKDSKGTEIKQKTNFFF